MYDTYNNTYTYTFIILTSTYRCPYYLTLLIDALPNTSKLGGSMPACERAARLSLLPVSVNRPYICIYIYTMYVYVYIYIYIYVHILQTLTIIIIITIMSVKKHVPFTFAAGFQPLAPSAREATLRFRRPTEGVR